MKTTSLKLIIAAIALFLTGTATQVQAGNQWITGQRSGNQQVIAIRSDLVNGLSSSGCLQVGGSIRFAGVLKYFVRNHGTWTHQDGSFYYTFVFSDVPVATPRVQWDGWIYDCAWRPIGDRTRNNLIYNSYTNVTGFAPLAAAMKKKGYEFFGSTRRWGK